MSLRFAAALFSLLIAASGTQKREPLRRAGFFGVQVVPVPDTMRAALRLEPGAGVLVQGLVDGGSAKSAGLQPNDVLTAVDSRAVTTVSAFVELVRTLRAGDTAAVVVRRGTETLTLRIPIRPRPIEQSNDANVRYDAIAVDGSLRRTIVTIPKEPGRHGAVLLVNGIGCFSQESLDLSTNDTKFVYGLSRAGFVTMRVEKSGMGDSEGPPCNSPEADFRAELRAYAAGLRALKRYGFVDPAAVFLLGVSIGGVEAPLLAAQEPVRGLVVINTVAKPFLEYLIETRRRQLLLAHTAYDEIDRRIRLDEQCNHELLIEKHHPDAVRGANAVCADHISYPAPFTFMQQWADVDPADAWKAVDRPVLIVYGTSDFVATIADHPYLADMINAFHPATASLRRIDGMDHTLSKAASMADSFARTGAGEFHPAVLEEVAAWMRDTCGAC